MVSSLRIWPVMALTSHPSSFSLGGSTSATGTFTEIDSTTNAQYTSNQWTQFDRMTLADPFSSYKLPINGAQSYPIYLNEIQFLDCNRVVLTTFSYPELPTLSTDTTSEWTSSPHCLVSLPVLYPFSFLRVST